MSAKGGSRVFEWDLDAGPLTFGRSTTVDLTIDSDILSREHGRFQRSGPDIVVLDLNSRNGIKLNGRRVWKPTPIKHGDKVSIGDVSLELRVRQGVFIDETITSMHGSDRLVDETEIADSGDLSIAPQELAPPPPPSPAKPAAKIDTANPDAPQPAPPRAQAPPPPPPATPTQPAPVEPPRAAPAPDPEVTEIASEAENAATARASMQVPAPPKTPEAPPASSTPPLPPPAPSPPSPPVPPATPQAPPPQVSAPASTEPAAPEAPPASAPPPSVPAEPEQAKQPSPPVEATPPAPAAPVSADTTPPPAPPPPPAPTPPPAPAPPPPPAPPTPAPPPEPEPEPELEPFSVEPNGDEPQDIDESIGFAAFENLPNLRSYDQTISVEDDPEGDSAPEMTQRRVIVLDRQRLVLGRDPKCDETLDSLMISRQNTEIVREGGQYFANDLNSTNGTLINGQRLTRRTELKPGDSLMIGPFHFDFDGRRLTCDPPQQGLEIRVQGLSVKEKASVIGQPRQVLQGVAFTVQPGSMVGLCGPSESGKTALLDALAGRRPDAEGHILFNGTDLYPHLRSLRSRIGIVPAYPIVHHALRVKHALRYASRLRLSPDVPRGEVDANISRVLAAVGLDDCREQAIRTLTTAQQKQLSLAVQLLSDPDLVLVDELTLGTDAGVDRQMMIVLRALAESGKTVIVVTPFPGSMDHCDQVVCLMEGQVVYDGPPAPARKHLELTTWQDIFGLDERQSADAWRQAYLETYDGAQRDAAARTQAGQYARAPKIEKLPLASAFGEMWLQWRVLTARSLRLLVAEKARLLSLLLLPILLGLLLGTAWVPLRKWGGGAAELDESVGLLRVAILLGGMLLGLFAGAREIASEWSIHLQERLAKLRLPVYLLSKVIPLGLLMLVQSALLLGTVQAWAGFDLSDLAPHGAVLFLTALVGTLLGLVVSAALSPGRSRSRQITGVLTALFVVQAVFSGGFAPLSLVGESVGRWGVACYWSVRATGAMQDGGMSGRPFGLAMLCLAAHLVVLSVLLWALMLGKKRPAVIRGLRERLKQADGVAG